MVEKNVFAELQPVTSESEIKSSNHLTMRMFLHLNLSF